MGCLRKLLTIKCRDKVPTLVVLIRADMTSTQIILCSAQLMWAGHVSHMSDKRLPKKIFKGELKHGKRFRGGQKHKIQIFLKYLSKRVLHCSYKLGVSCPRPLHNNSNSNIHAGAVVFLNSRTSKAIQKRAKRKARASASSTAVLTPAIRVNHSRTHFRVRIA